jgi:hypothetical protein
MRLSSQIAAAHHRGLAANAARRSDDARCSAGRIDCLFLSGRPGSPLFSMFV